MTRHYQRAIISELHSLGISFADATTALQSSGTLRATAVTAIYRWEQRFGRAFPRTRQRAQPSVLRDTSSIKSRDPLIRQIFTTIAQHGISLEQLVSGTGLSRRTIWDIRSGKAKDPGVGKVRRLAKVAGLAWPERLAGVDTVRGEAYVTPYGAVGRNGRYHPTGPHRVRPISVTFPRPYPRSLTRSRSLSTLRKVKIYDSCVHCNRRFVIYRMKQKFCSVACRVAHHRDAKRAVLAEKLARLDFLEQLVGEASKSEKGG